MRRDGDGDDQDDWLSERLDQRYDTAEEEGQSEKAEGAKESRWSEGEDVAGQEAPPETKKHSGAQAHLSLRNAKMLLSHTNFINAQRTSQVARSVLRSGNVEA
jgi:hypothetical protein